VRIGKVGCDTGARRALRAGPFVLCLLRFLLRLPLCFVLRRDRVRSTLDARCFGGIRDVFFSNVSRVGEKKIVII